MMDKLMDSLKKSGKKPKMLSENEQKAKMSVLEELKQMAMDAMGEKLSGTHSAKIVSDSEEGLKEGAELLSEKLEGESDEEDMAEGEEGESEEELDMPSEGFEEEVKDYSDLSQDEVEAEIEKLLKLKEQMKAKSFGIK